MVAEVFVISSFRIGLCSMQNLKRSAPAIFFKFEYEDQAIYYLWDDADVRYFTGAGLPDV